jgi:hypothetical protein
MVMQNKRNNPFRLRAVQWLGLAMQQSRKLVFQ